MGIFPRPYFQGSSVRSLLFTLYRVLGFCVWPLARAVAPLSGILPGRAAYCFPERVGIYAAEKLEGQAPVVWLHAASVGEVRAALLVLRALQSRFPRYRYLLSTTTRQGAELALAQKKPLMNLCCILAPLDAPQSVHRALSAFRPILYICLETELWPMLLSALAKRNTPVFLANGRLSERSFVRYRKLGSVFAAVAGNFTSMALISQTDAHRFAALGAPPERMHVTGNLKFDLPFDAAAAPAVREKFRARLGIKANERLLLCGSTHDGEEALLLSAYVELTQKMALTLVLAPRHLERLEEVEALIRARGLSFVRYSQVKGERLAQVIVLDTMGDLADLYAAGDFLFCGGSLLPRLGGHNVMEAARWGRPVYFGPHMRDWRDAATLLGACGGAFQVKDMQEFVTLVSRHAACPEEYKKACLAAAQAADGERGALKRQLELIAAYLT